MTTQSNTRLGIVLMMAVSVVFSLQDGISRHLADNYNVLMVVMIRYWFFAAFVITVATRKAGGWRAAARTEQPFLQTFRGILLAAEICVMVSAFTILGLVESHAVFACYPLLVAALSGPVLRERVGWRRWTAIGVGFLGVLVILQPGLGVFDVAAVIPLLSSTMFALYGLLTRYAARARQHRHKFFLDRHCRRNFNDRGRPVVLGTDEPTRLGVDGRAVHHRRHRALASDPLL